MSPGRTRTMSPGTSSRAGMTCQLESRRTRALTCNRRRNVSTTPAARRSCAKLNTALTTRSALTTARSEYFPSTADRTMISSSIHADRPQNFAEKCEDRVPLLHGHFIVAVLLPTDVHLRAREPCLGVHMERRERVGNGRGCDVRCLGGSCWRRARDPPRESLGALFKDSPPGLSPGIRGRTRKTKGGGTGGGRGPWRGGGGGGDRRAPPIFMGHLFLCLLSQASSSQRLPHAQYCLLTVCEARRNSDNRAKRM